MPPKKKFLVASFSNDAALQSFLKQLEEKNREFTVIDVNERLMSVKYREATEQERTELIRKRKEQSKYKKGA